MDLPFQKHWLQEKSQQAIGLLHGAGGVYEGSSTAPFSSKVSHRQGVYHAPVV